MPQDTQKGANPREEGSHQHPGQAQHHEKSGQQSGQGGQQQHGSSYKCSVCGKSFNSENEHREHERTHKGQQRAWQSGGQAKR